MAQEHVRVKRGVQRLYSVGGVDVAIDRVTGQRALVIDTPAGRYPCPISHEDYLKLGIEIIRDSGCVHDFSEVESEPESQLSPVVFPQEDAESPPDMDMERPDRPDQYSLLTDDVRPEEG